MRVAMSGSSVPGRIIGTFFFLFFLGAGCVFEFMLLAGFLRTTARPYLWQATECTVTDSRLTERHDKGGDPFAVTVSFSCEAGGTADQHRETHRFSSLQEAQDLADGHAPGQKVTAYVNPDHPEEAVLIRKSPWSALSLLFPLIFIGVGAGGLYWTWRARPRRAEAISSQAISAQASGTIGAGVRLVGSGFFGLFFLAGALILYLLAIGPLIQMVRARAWVETPCVVLSSEVKSSSDGDTFRPEIIYRYTFNGREYRSNRYDFSTGSSSGYESKKRVVDRYSPGSHSVAYVNPNHPSESVLNRSLTSDLWWGLFGLPFFLVGAGGLYFVLGYRPAMISAPDWQPAVVAREVGVGDYRSQTGAIELKAKASPVGKFVGITLVALFWNGITGLFVWQVIETWSRGESAGWLTVFLIPFVAVGLLLVYGIFYQLLALFNPRVTLRLSSGTMCPGDSVDLEWGFTGRTGVLRQVIIRLKGVEEATYRRGTTSHTDRNTFHESEIARATGATQITSGRTRLQIPEDTMHSFKSSHNKISWSLQVSGAIARWPDVDQDFEIAVLPLPAHRIRAG